MKTNVELGKCYALRSAMGGVVTDGEGRELATLEPNQQLHLTAQESEWIVPEDCRVTKVNFKLARLALRMLGAGKKSLPAGYIQALFLASAGAANINTPYRSGPDTGLYCKSEATFGNRDAMGYATQMSVPRPRFAGYNPQTIGAGWAGSNVELLNPLPKSVILNGWLNWKNSKIARAASELGEQTAELVGEPTAGQITIFKANSSWYGRIYKAGVSEGNKVSSMYVPAVDASGNPCLYDTILKTPLYNTTSTPFVVGLTLAQLATLLKRLPDTGGSLTLSLPAEANTPEIADKLTAVSSEKGWTLTVYEYRPAAVATYSLRRVREVVWCRKQAAEYGGYVDTAGKRWQVERCAAIFGEHGNDPAAYGYEPFDSVEQAAEEWGLTPIMEFPEEDLTETE